jgi:hypothetical protein
MSRKLPRHLRTLSRTLTAALLSACALPALAALDPAEKAVLISLYDNTDGANWTDKTGWDTPASDPCADNWHGVACNGAGTSVLILLLYINNLSGTLPSTLNQLPALTLVSVAGNRLTGPIPDLSGLTALEGFYAGGNQLSGSIPDLSGLTALVGFSVTANQLTGPIPSLSGLTALEGFAVGGNELTGPIPSLSGLTALEGFYANNNQLTGPIPSLSGLTALKVFYAPFNQLTGPLPGLSGLTALRDFYVHNNQLTGPIPDLSGLTALRDFYVHNNQLTGPIPDLGGLTALERFYARNNQLTGTPPAAPPNLLADGSALCPNLLHTPSPTDAAWDAATPGVSWSTGCTPGYVVSPSAGPGGSVGPDQGVAAGLTATIAITPDAGQVVDAVTSSCGGALTGNDFTTGAVNADCTVAVTFRAAAPTAAAVTPVPTLGEWGLMLLGLLAAGLGARRLRRVG